MPALQITDSRSSTPANAASGSATRASNAPDQAQITRQCGGAKTARDI